MSDSTPRPEPAHTGPSGASPPLHSLTWPTRSRPPDPFEDAQALEDLEEEIGTLAAHVHAANHRLLELIAEFDRRQGWKLGGHRNCADWLHFRTGFDRGTAREKVRAARALRTMPHVSVGMARGELSFSKVRALTRLAGSLDAQAEEELASLARSLTTAELEKVVRRWARNTRVEEGELERRRHRARCLSVFPDEEGGYVVRGRLDPEVGAMLMRALEAAADALHRPGETWAACGGPRGPVSEEVTPTQRRADAIGLLAERALAAGFGSDATSPSADGSAADPAGRTDPSIGNACAAHLPAPEDVSGETSAAISAETSADHDPDASAPSAGARPVPLSGTRAERYQVILHVDERSLVDPIQAGLNPTGQDFGDAHAARSGADPVAAGAGPSHLEDGTRLTAETSRRLCCDASTVRVMRGEGGEVLDVGRRTRTIPPALRRALEVRDGGCRFPGCGLRFTEAHHIQHWVDGGETRLGNLVLLCRAHHRALHEDGFRVRSGPDGKLRFLDPLGWPLPDRAPPPRVSDRPVEVLLRGHRARGVDPDGWACASRYLRQADIPWDVEARLRESLDS